MIELDLNMSGKELNGADMVVGKTENGPIFMTLGKALAPILGTKTPGINKSKGFLWAQTLANKKPIQIDEVDAKALKTFLFMDNNGVDNWLAHQVGEIIDEKLAEKKY
jgi:hypothetical protein